MADAGLRAYPARSYSTEDFIQHVMDSGLEYNDLYAYPSEWPWTNQKMRRWFAEHQP
jgi:hypothetical protein